MKGFCEKKFYSMFLSGTFTKAVMYIMLLCDSIIAGHYIGASGVAAINAITPVTGIVTFFGDLVSTGVGIVYSRERGAMRKKRADEIYSQGLIISISIGLISAITIFLIQNVYFSLNGITGEILDESLKYYQFLPINAFLTIVVFYLEQMVYSDDRRPARRRISRIVPKKPSVAASTRAISPISRSGRAPAARDEKKAGAVGERVGVRSGVLTGIIFSVSFHGRIPALFRHNSLFS